MNEARSLVRQSSNSITAVGDYPLATTDRLDLSGSVSFFRKRIKIILACAALGLLAGLVVSALADKIYTAKATVMLTDEASTSANLGTTPASRSSFSSELVDTQVEILTSREMSRRVAAALVPGDALQGQQLRNFIDTLQKNIAAKRTGDSYALTISYDGASASGAATAVNEFARQFTNWELNADKERNNAARALVEERLTELRGQAQTDMQALQQYRIANNLLSTSGASLTEQEISNYNQQVSQARAEAAADQARLATALAQLRSGSTGDDVGEALGSPVVSALRTQEAQLAGEVASLSARYGPNYPQLIQSRKQLEEIRQRIQAEIGRVVSNLRAKQDVSSQRLASLSSSLSSAKANLSQNNSAMVGLSDLERASEASKGIYETYLTSYKQLLAAEGSEKPHARILTMAEPPLLPSSPNILLNAALSLLIGLGLGVVAAYIANALFVGVSSPEEVGQVLGERFLGSIPLLSSVSDLPQHPIEAIRDQPRSAFAESFKALRTSVDHAVDHNAQIIAVTSALPREGKTITSTCLAHVLASSGARTMLIDCDLRRRGVSRLLNIGADHRGLIEVLDGSAKLDLKEFEDDGIFCVLPLKPMVEEPEHLLTGRAFVDFLEELRQNFDRIILDLPPVLPIAATRIIASRADAVIMAAKWNHTPAAAIRAALGRLPFEHVNVAGVALTQIDMRRKGYFGREDPAFYYSKYREYYA